MFTETDVNPMNYLNLNPEEWFCFPMKVGGLLCYVYFNAKYTASALSLANLFEIATKEETSAKPDLVVIFGNEDGKNATEFYHDTDNDIWVGTHFRSPRIEYFGYLKKMSLTPHNLAMMEKGWYAHSRRLREHHPEGWPQEGHHAHGRFRRREI